MFLTLSFIIKFFVFFFYIVAERCFILSFFLILQVCNSIVINFHGKKSCSSLQYRCTLEVSDMKQLWKYRVEFCIALSGVLLLGSLLFPTTMPEELYVLLLILFLVSIVLLKLNGINNYLKKKIQKGGRIL